MSKTKRVYRFGHGCGCVRNKAFRPSANPERPEDGSIRNPRTSWALRLHSCRALSSQPRANPNPLLTIEEACNPCAQVLPMCLGESVTYVSERTEHSFHPLGTARFCSVPRNDIFSYALPSRHHYPAASPKPGIFTRLPQPRSMSPKENRQSSARMSPICQVESVTYVSERTHRHQTRVVPHESHSVPRT